MGFKKPLLSHSGVKPKSHFLSLLSHFQFFGDWVFFFFWLGEGKGAFEAPGRRGIVFFIENAEGSPRRGRGAGRVSAGKFAGGGGGRAKYSGPKIPPSNKLPLGERLKKQKFPKNKGAQK